MMFQKLLLIMKKTRKANLFLSSKTLSSLRSPKTKLKTLMSSLLTKASVIFTIKELLLSNTKMNVNSKI